MDKYSATEPHSLSLSFLFCDVGRGVGVLHLLEASLIPCFLIPLPGDTRTPELPPTLNCCKGMFVPSEPHVRRACLTLSTDLQTAVHCLLPLSVLSHPKSV